MPADAAIARRPQGIDLAADTPFRRPIGRGRAHVDRPLPFLILNRFDPAESNSLAARVAATSPAYVAWPAADDGEASDIIAELVSANRRDRLLLVSLYDLPRDPGLDDTAPKLEKFVARISASDDAGAQSAASCLAEALGKIEVDLRTCQVEHVAEAWFEPGVEALVRASPRVSHISVGLPQNYRVPGEDGIYPQLLHELATGVFDALLHAAHAFIAATAPDPPASHRALGRRSFIDAARSVDRKLLRIATAFDFLLGVSPINSEQAYAQFKADKWDAAPAFRYRPLTVDPDLTKRALYAIDLKRVEDPVLETLFAEKREELDRQLTMLAARNTPAFRYASLMLYGAVEPELLAAANDILARAPDDSGGGEAIGAEVVCKGAEALIARYRTVNPHFKAKIHVREDIPAGLMVSGHKLMIAASTRMPRHRLDALLQHEVSVHLLTCVNGDAQGLKIFRTGLAGYEGVQEGLGVFAECAVGGLTRARLRLLAARVRVVDGMIEGASFIDSYRLLRAHHFGPRMAFAIAARVHRSGGFAKDAIYLRGFKEVLDLLAAGSDLAPFWYGKIAARHIPVVEELALRGLLQPPRTLPEFLDRPDAAAHIAAMRSAATLAELL